MPEKNTPLQCLTHILRRHERRRRVPGVPNQQHRIARLHPEIAPVVLLGRHIPLCTLHVDVHIDVTLYATRVICSLNDRLELREGLRTHRFVTAFYSLGRFLGCSRVAGLGCQICIYCRHVPGYGGEEQLR